MAGVKTLHADYNRLSPLWERCRDVIAGERAMHQAAERYLPKLKEESDADYKARVCRSDYFNASWRTIDALGGMAFRKSPSVKVPTAIERYLEDVTMSGVAMEDFAKEVLEEELTVGRIGILVDYPAQPENVVALTVDAAQQMGLRPTLQTYAAESIRNWKYARINNAWVLKMVVLGEKEAVPEDEFSEKLEDRYRVLDLDDAGNYRQRVFAVDKDGKDVLMSEVYPLMNGKPLTFVPFKIVDPNGKNDSCDDPPLIDLIDKNVAHYQVNSDYRHGLHYTALPTLFLAGIEDEMGADGKPKKIQIGGSAAVTSRHPEARGEFIEYKGQGLQTHEKALDRLERQMALLGARMLADEAQQAETLGATQIKRAGENSVLAKIVRSVGNALEWALGVFAQWAGASGEITYELNRDFLPTMIDAQTLGAIFAGVQSGNISKQEAFELLQRGDVIDGEKTYDEHAEQIDATTPAPVRPTPKEPPAQAAA
jgi:hypothetical protein